MKNQVTLCGVRSCLNLIADSTPNLHLIRVWSLRDGTVINAREVVLQIEGPYWCFAFLEGKIDGILTHQTTIATNAARLVRSAGPHQIIYMNDRSNFFDQQAREGYAAYIGGIRIFTAQGQTEHIGIKNIKIVGSIPHSFIQLYKGDLLRALQDYRTVFPNDQLVALIDFTNDCLGTIKQIKSLLPHIYAVRIDTARDLIDRTFTKIMLRGNNCGVNPTLVRRVRCLLDNMGYHNIKIIVSSGFTPTTIQQFELLKIPVDFFGVGLAFNQNLINFTGDAVRINDQLCAKAGRKYQENPKLKLIDIKKYQTND